MSKPSELLDDILDDVIALRRIGAARLDGELRDRIEQELRDAARLTAQATAAANAAADEGVEHEPHGG